MSTLLRWAGLSGNRVLELHEERGGGYRLCITVLDHDRRCAGSLSFSAEEWALAVKIVA